MSTHGSTIFAPRMDQSTSKWRKTLEFDREQCKTPQRIRVDAAVLQYIENFKSMAQTCVTGDLTATLNDISSTENRRRSDGWIEWLLTAATTVGATTVLPRDTNMRPMAKPSSSSPSVLQRIGIYDSESTFKPGRPVRAA